MPTPTYDLIASNVLSSSASSVTFSSIPATYRDLIVVVTSTGAGSGTMRFNGDTGSNYSTVAMYGDGSSAFSMSGTGTDFIFANMSEVSVSITQIMDYSATDKHKTVLGRYGRASGQVWARATRWANTAAINQITMTHGTFGAGATFYLYGIVS